MGTQDALAHGKRLHKARDLHLRLVSRVGARVVFELGSSLLLLLFLALFFFLGRRFVSLLASGESRVNLRLDLSKEKGIVLVIGGEGDARGGNSQCSADEEGSHC